MTQDKHTPGPWLFVAAGGTYEIGTGDWVDWGDGDFAFSDFQVARVWQGMREAKANAHLIAAAPDMLEALEDVLKYLENDMIAEHTARPERRKVRAAIAKARGENT